MLCVICTGAKCHSCLVYFVLYWKISLEPPWQISVLEKHKLINPLENLESRVRKKHDEYLELFCKVDQMFVSSSCKEVHKTHRIVWRMRLQLGNKKKDVDHVIPTHQLKISSAEKNSGKEL